MKIRFEQLKKTNLKSDVTAGFMVFLIALPLCLGIAKASGFPPISGIYTAVVGGLLVSFLTNSQLTIKGPAAGLIVIAIGAVEELGDGSLTKGYQLTLAVLVISGLIQIVLGILKSGNIGDFFPPAVIHGMLAAIGIIIVAKQLHFALGVVPTSKETFALLEELPQSVMSLNPEVALIGIVSLVILFSYPYLKNILFKKLPAPLLVLAIAIPIGMYFDLSQEHDYDLGSLQFHIDPSQLLVSLPNEFFKGITFPDFSQITSLVSLKYIVMFSLVGSIESLLSAKAIDTLDPQKRKSNLNRDLIAIGVGNTLLGFIGGLPMISEIVRSSANINAGARTKMSNFFHAAFMFLFAMLAAPLIQKIPNAALSAMLIYTGVKLAAPIEFKKVKNIGYDQLLVFVVTLFVTLKTDLLLGVGAGIVTKIVFHILQGAKLKELFFLSMNKEKLDDVLVLNIEGAAVFTNYLKFKSQIKDVSLSSAVKINFSQTKLVDHTFLANLHYLQNDFYAENGDLELIGFEQHHYQSSHPLSSRRFISNPSMDLAAIELTVEQRSLQLIAQKLGYSFEEKMTLPIVKHFLSSFPIVPHIRIAQNLLFGNEREFNIVTCKIHYDEIGEFSIERRQATLAIVNPFNSADLPAFYLGRYSCVVNSSYKEFPKLQFTDDQEGFGNKFRIYTDNENDVRNLLTIEVKEFLLKNDKYVIETRKGILLIHRNMQSLPIVRTEDLSEFSKTFIRLLLKV